MGRAVPLRDCQVKESVFAVSPIFSLSGRTARARSQTERMKITFSPESAGYTYKERIRSPLPKVKISYRLFSGAKFRKRAYT